MFGFLKYFTTSKHAAAQRRREDTHAQDAGRILEMDEPMAAAGAELDAMHTDSETEEALRRASGTRERS